MFDPSGVGQKHRLNSLEATTYTILDLFAVASLAVFLAHPLRETLESELGMFDLGLSFPPGLLGAGLDLFFQHLRSLGAGFRVMAQFLGGANHESAKKTHLRMHPV